MYEKKKKENPDTLCKYNIGVDCEKKEFCDNCGWNPKVDEERSVAYQKNKICKCFVCGEKIHCNKSIEENRKSSFVCTYCGTKYEIKLEKGE